MELYLQPIRNPALRGNDWLAPHSRRFTPGKDPLPIVQEAGLASGTVCMARKMLSPPEFEPQTVQPDASLYADNNALAARLLSNTIQ